MTEKPGMFRSWWHVASVALGLAGLVLLAGIAVAAALSWDGRVQGVMIACGVLAIVGSQVAARLGPPMSS